MTQSKLTAGDLVRVTSGGPIMTAELIVDELDEPYARCIWFDSRDKRQSASIKTAALELIPRSS